MKIYRTEIPYADPPGRVLADTVQHEEKLWVVPHWLDSPVEKCSRPARMFRIDHLPHEKIDREEQGHRADYLLRDRIPKAILDGVADPQTAALYEAIDRPQLDLPVNRKRVAERSNAIPLSRS